MEKEKEKDIDVKKNATWLKKRQATARVVAAILVVLVILCAIGASCYGLKQFLLLRNPHFVCRTLDYQPTPNFSAKKMQTMLEEMGEERGCILGRSNLLSMDICAIRDKLLKEPTIRSVKVRRIIPGTLKLELTERTPFAMLSSGTMIYALIDNDGHTFMPTNPTTMPKNLPLITNVKGAERIPLGEKCNDSAVKAALAFLEGTSGGAQIKGAEFTTVAIVLNYDLERLECHIRGIPGNKIYAKDTVVCAPFEAGLMDEAIKKFHLILSMKIKNGETLSFADMTLETRIRTLN